MILYMLATVYVFWIACCYCCFGCCRCWFFPLVRVQFFLRNVFICVFLPFACHKRNLVFEFFAFVLRACESLRKLSRVLFYMLLLLLLLCGCFCCIILESQSIFQLVCVIWQPEFLAACISQRSTLYMMLNNDDDDDDDDWWKTIRQSNVVAFIVVQSTQQ